MLHHFAPGDNLNEDSDIHKQTRMFVQEPINTEGGKEFTVEEIGKGITSLGNKTAAAEDDITGEIYRHTYEILPKYITELWNGCLRLGVFLTGWKRTKVITVTKQERKTAKKYLKFDQ